jgi:MFS family permease
LVSRAYTRLAFLEPLRHPDFRTLSVVSSINAVGMLGGQVALGWFVLDLTDSVFMVGLIIAIRLLPNFFFGVPAGAVADLVDRRRMIQVLNLLMAIPMVILGLLIMADQVKIWQVIALTLVGGMMMPFNQVARASLTFDITGGSGVVYGLTLMQFATRVGGLAGSIVIGIVMQRVGMDAAFFLLGLTYGLAALIALLIKSRGQAAPTNTLPAGRLVSEFVKEIRSNRPLLALTISTGLLEVMGFSHSVLLPNITRDILGMDAEGLGLISGLRHLGGLLAVVLIAGMGDRLKKGLTYQVSIFLFGCLLIILGFTGQVVAVVVVLIGLSALMALTDVLSQSLMQLVVSNNMRGRAMGSWMVAVGVAPVGHLQVGGVAAVAGMTLALSLNGLGLVILSIGLFALVPSMKKA